jgi:hypothetical protein
VAALLTSALDNLQNYFSGTAYQASGRGPEAQLSCGYRYIGREQLCLRCNRYAGTFSEETGKLKAAWSYLACVR